MARRFIDAPDDVRCVATITLRDKSKARCGRRVKKGSVDGFCWQHERFFGVADLPARPSEHDVRQADVGARPRGTAGLR